MSKYNPNKLPYPVQDRLMNNFCLTLARLGTKDSIRDFLKDLLNRQERLMLVRRLLIAELLTQGKTYKEIRFQLKTGRNTITRVNRWLNFGRNGYRKAIEADKKKQ